jgi:ABC-type transporter Mla MlaB component
MLRITRTTTPDDTTLLRLEGKLLAPWVPEVQGQCERAYAVRLDLAQVSYVDGTGLALLIDLRRRGAPIVACSGFVSELLYAEKP